MAHVHVEVELDEFSDDDLIEELEARGYQVLDEDSLTEEEKAYIRDLCSETWPGDIRYSIYEKLMK